MSDRPPFSWFRRSRADGPPGAELDCEDLRASGSDWLDDDLPESLSTRIRNHLGLCNDCDGWLKSLATTVGLLRDMPAAEAPESTREKVRRIARGDG
ncbi:MAG: hypothetical protein V3S18_04415 [Dehalococcoidia bacterium]